MPKITKRNKSARPVVPTLSQVEAAFRATNNHDNVKLSEYASCSLDPFSTPGGVMIPDGSTGKRIVIDHRMYMDVTPANGSNSFTFKVLPIMPCPVIFKPLVSSTGSLNIGGISYTQATLGAMTDQAWIVPRIYPEYSPMLTNLPNSFATITPDPPLYDCTKARFVSIAYRVYYTGPANNASGLITVSGSSIGVNRMGNAEAIRVWDAQTDSVSSVYPASELVTNRLAIGATSALNVLTSDTVMHRPEVGAYGHLKHLSPTHDFVPYYNNPLLLVSSDADFESTSPVAYLCVNGGYFGGGINLIDDGWSSQDVVITYPTTTNISYRIEVISCVEYMINPTSSVARFAKDPPRANQSQLTKVNTALKNMPVASPLTGGNMYLERPLNPNYSITINGSTNAASQQVRKPTTKNNMQVRKGGH